MQILLDLIEVFLPDIARAMSGSSVLPLRRRFFRAGVGFFTILIAYVAIRVIWSVLVGREQPSPGMFHLERPRVSLRLVDPNDQAHDLDIVVQNSMRHPVLVFLDGFPLAFSDKDE